jgi:hypothetical protein
MREFKTTAWAGMVRKAATKRVRQDIHLNHKPRAGVELGSGGSRILDQGMPSKKVHIQFGKTI